MLTMIKVSIARILLSKYQKRINFIYFTEAVGELVIHIVTERGFLLHFISTVLNLSENVDDKT